MENPMTTSMFVVICLLAAASSSLANELKFTCVPDQNFTCSPKGCTKEPQRNLRYLFKFDPLEKIASVQDCEGRSGKTEECSGVQKLLNVKGNPEGGFSAAATTWAFTGTVPYVVTPTEFTYASIINGWVTQGFGRCVITR
jgi:hypothetical protein